MRSCFWASRWSETWAPCSTCSAPAVFSEEVQRLVEERDGLAILSEAQAFCRFEVCEDCGFRTCLRRTYSREQVECCNWCRVVGSNHLASKKLQLELVPGALEVAAQVGGAVVAASEHAIQQVDKASSLLKAQGMQKTGLKQN